MAMWGSRSRRSPETGTEVAKAASRSMRPRQAPSRYGLATVALVIATGLVAR
jgi:hypothetical protein